MTALLYTAVEGDEETFISLLKHGADVMKKNEVMFVIDHLCAYHMFVLGLCECHSLSVCIRNK